MDRENELKIDIFNQPPNVLSKKQQFILGQAGILFDSIDLNYQRLTQSSKIISLDGQTSANKEIILWTTNCAWRILDCQYQLTKLINLLVDRQQDQPETTDISVDLTPEFAIALRNLRSFDRVVAGMRNAMDHIAGNIDNLINKSLAAPIHGALSFVAFNDATPITLISHTVMCDPVTKSTSVTVNPADLSGKHFRPPVDFFHFSAFSEFINLTELVDTVIQFKGVASRTIEVKLRQRLEQIASGSDVELTEILSSPPAYLHLVMEFARTENSDQTGDQTTHTPTRPDAM